MLSVLRVAALSALAFCVTATPVSQDNARSIAARQTTYPSDTAPAYPAAPNFSHLATVYTKCAANNTVALTFDDGPGVYEPALLNVLAQYGAKATFFLNGNNWRCIYNQEQVDSVRAIYAAGHQIGSHTWSHVHMKQQQWTALNTQLWKIEQALIRIVGVNPYLFRPPYGEYNNTVLAALYSRNQTAVTWDFDSGDSTGLTAAQSNALYDGVASRKPANLLALNHSVYNSTVSTVIPHALQVLSALKKYKFVTVSECLGLSKSYQWTRAPEPRTAKWVC